MIPIEILERIRRIHITTTRLATSIFAGEYKSVFKGRGLEFHELREYVIGDDVRSIDWNVTARTGKLHIKKFVEERELTIMILLDLSRSHYFGSVKDLKQELAAELASVLAASANKNNDKVGLLIFTDKVEKFIPPHKGAHHNLRLIREVLYYKPEGRGTDMPLALEYLDRVTTRSAVAFIISDFYSDNIKKSLTLANKRHDVIAVRLSDPRDFELPNVGMIQLADAETGRLAMVDTSQKRVREEYHRRSLSWKKNTQNLLDSVGVDIIDVSTAAPYTESLIEFFERRRARRRLRI